MFRWYRWNRWLQAIFVVILLYKMAKLKFKTHQNIERLSSHTKLEENSTLTTAKTCFKIHGFNECLSNQISVRRKIPDQRSNHCKNKEMNLSTNLPPTSIIITFYNEAWSTLLRSVHSVLDHSQEVLVEEILLVDDYSDMSELLRHDASKIKLKNFL